MEDLEQQLIKANEEGRRFKIIVTDGVFSMDGVVAPLDKIVI
jgi:glycine C-acetyltransferase